MIEFKVNRNRIIKYLTKYGFNDPEDFFLTDNLEDGIYVYSISSTEVSYKKKALKVGLRESLTIIANKASDDYSPLTESLIEDLSFLICYLGVFKDHGVSTNHFTNNTGKNISMLTESAIHLKNGCLPVKVTIDYGIPIAKGNKTIINNSHPVVFDTFASAGYLFNHHYLVSLAKFLNINITNPQFQCLLDPKSTVEELMQLRSDTIIPSLTSTEEIIYKSILLLRDFLEEELNIRRTNAKHISAHQLRLLERIFDFLDWRDISKNTKEEDGFRKYITRMIDKYATN